MQEARLSEPYRRRLEAGARALAQWAGALGRSVETELGSASSAAELLIGFTQFIFDSGGPVWLPTHAILAVQTARRHYHGKLKAAWDSIESCRLLSPTRSRAPMPLVVLEGLRTPSNLFACTLDGGSAISWWCFSAFLGLMFWGLMRPGELYNLRADKLRVPGPHPLLFEPVAVMTIENPKNRRFVGRLQVWAVRDDVSVAWASWLAAGLSASENVWLFSPGLFKRKLREAPRSLGREGLGITPASCRAGGGATAMMERGVPPNVIRFRGCWASERAMESYLQEAEELDLVQACNKKSNAVRMAKKVIKLQLLADEIKEALNKIEPVGRKMKTGRKAVVVTTAPQLAIVPYVPTVPTPTVSAPSPCVPHGICFPSLRELTREWAQRLMLPLYIAKIIVIWLPALLAYIGLFYISLAGMHIASDPGVLVDWRFALVDLIPAYFEHAGSKILAAFQKQLAARFR